MLTVQRVVEEELGGALSTGGWQRTEGREYRVADGDILHILHNK